MAWSQPKTNWAASDALSTTDLNRIEENILSRQYVVAGCVGGESSFTTTASSKLIQTVSVRVPDDYRMLIERANWNFEDGSVDGVSVYASSSSIAGVEWSGASSGGDEAPSHTLFTNTSGASVLALVTVSVDKGAGETYTALYPYDGWHFGLSVRPVA